MGGSDFKCAPTRFVAQNYFAFDKRGHNRQAVFAAGENSAPYRADLRELKGLFGVGGYAYYSIANYGNLRLASGESVAELV